MKIILASIFVFVIFSLSCFNWKRSVKAVLIILILEGALRKWVLPEANYLIYFFKDIVLLGAYIRYYYFSPAERKTIFKNDFLHFIIYLVVGWCLFQAFNPALGSPIVGIIGIRAYLFNIPLIWMMPNLFKTTEELIIFLKRYLLTSIPLCILGIIQFFSPISSPINTYAGGDVPTFKIASYGGFVRISSTFSYLDTYVLYLIVTFALLIPIIQFVKSKSWYYTLLIALVLVIANSFMTSSRSCVFASALFLFLYLFISIFFGDQVSSNLAKKLFVPFMIIIICSSFLFRPSIDNFTARTEEHGGAVGLMPRIERIITDPFTQQTYKNFDGYGSGATQLASKAIRRVLKLPYGERIKVGYEEEPERIMLELGVIGFVFWYLLKTVILSRLWRTFKQLKYPLLKNLALSVFLIHVIQFIDQLVTHHTFSVYYWFLTGFIFLLPKLDKQENLKFNKCEH